MSGLHLSQRYKDWLFIKGDEQESDTSGDLISRQAVLNILEREGHKWGNDYRDWVDAVNEVETLPPVNPQEPKTGHWILDETDNSITCDKCGCLIWANDISNGEAYYCPNCGADMRGDSE